MTSRFFVAKANFLIDGVSRLIGSSRHRVIMELIGSMSPVWIENLVAEKIRRLFYQVIDILVHKNAKDILGLS